LFLPGICAHGAEPQSDGQKIAGGERFLQTPGQRGGYRKALKRRQIFSGILKNPSFNSRHLQ